MLDTSNKLMKHAISNPLPGRGAPDFAVGRLLLRRKHVGSWRLEIPSGELTGSRRCFEIFGAPYPEKPLRFEAIFAGFVAQDRPKAAELLKQAIQQKCGFEFTSSILVGDDQTRHVECLGDVSLSANGSVTAIVGTVTDISEQVNRERLALGRSMMLTALLERMPAAIAVLDTDMNYVLVSEHWAVGHGGISSDKLKGRNFYAVQSDMITDEMRREHAQVLAGATLNRERCLIRDSKGNPISQICTMTPWYRSKGEIGGMLIMMSQVDTHHGIDASSERPTRDEFSQLLDNVA